MSIGARLAEARTEAGLSVDEVAQATRIRATLVRALEADDFSACGGSAYARGHLRSVARAVGTDPAPLLAEYDASYGSPVHSLTAPAFDRGLSESTAPRRPNWAAAMVAALVVVCALLAVPLFVGGSRTSPGGGAGAPVAAPSPTGSASPPAPAASRAPAPGPRPTDAVALVNPKVATLRVRVVQRRSWLSVTGASGRVIFEGVLSRGAQQDFTDPRGLKVVVGDAGAVALVANGHDLGPAGPAGQVKTLSLGPGEATAASG